QKGSIGFIATTTYGYDYALNAYSHQFYKALSVTKYNQGVGDMIKEAAFKNSITSDPFMLFVNLDMSLHGDPAIRISNGLQPDYQLKNSDVKFDLKKYLDSVGITINYKNTGKAIRDSI